MNEVLDIIGYIIITPVYLFMLAMMIYVFYDVISSFFKMQIQNKKWLKKNGGRPRKRCIDCPHCIKYKSKSKPYYVHQWSYTNAVYCRRFRRNLSSDSRCIASDASQAYYEVE